MTKSKKTPRKYSSVKKPARKPRSDKGVKRKPQPAVVSLAIPDRGDPRYLRFAAAQTYITTPGMALADLLKIPEFGEVLNESQVKRWSAEDHWVERRQEFVDKLQNHIQTKLGHELAHSRTEQIRAFQALYDKGLQKATQMAEKELLEVRSFETLMAALTRAFVALDDQKAKLMEQVVPEVPNVMNTPMEDDSVVHESIRPRLSHEEGRTIIQLLLTQRREKMRDQLRATGKLKDEDLHGKPVEKRKKPPKRTVKPE